MKILLPFLLIGATALAKPLSPKDAEQTIREIDQSLLDGQKSLDLTANPVIDDATFLRRSYLNIIGRLPSHDEARGFLESGTEDKRAKLIDTLVDSPGFNSRLFNFWSDLLRLKTREEHHGLGWHVWLKNSVENNLPYDDMVKAMLAADGHAADNPAAGYYLRDRGMLLDNVSNTVQVFLGQQIGCAQCHDHPFDDTTQMEYYQLAAFLGGTEYRFEGAREKVREVVGAAPEMRGMNRKKFAKMSKRERREFAKKNKGKRNEARDIASVFRYHNRNALTDLPGKELKLPDDYQYDDGEPGEAIKPGFLFGLDAKDVSPEKRRAYFANWVTSPKNPYFTKVIANRMWKYVFGYGLVANPDDWSSSPKPHFPELVTQIEKAMLATDYDLKEFLRILYHTQLFQREVTVEQPAQGFSFDFKGPVLRRLNAEEIRDSFVTLASGNIDSNTNQSFEESWQEYVTSFKFLMNANPKQIREIDKSADEAEKKRREFQREVSLLRTKARTAKNEGNEKLARKLSLEIREKQQQARRAYVRKGAMMSEDKNMNPAIAKAQAATMRRAPGARPDHPEFKLRASELASPQRGGSFIAEFGGSDAESPSSAHTQATVPQSLRLLNGNETSLLTNRKNAFARALQNIKKPENRLDYLFLSLYSAFPTEAEKEAFLPEVQTSDSTATFARAILTSNRFLFVQ